MKSRIVFQESSRRVFENLEGQLSRGRNPLVPTVDPSFTQIRDSSSTNQFGVRTRLNVCRVNRNRYSWIGIRSLTNCVVLLVVDITIVTKERKFHKIFCPST